MDRIRVSFGIMVRIRVSIIVRIRIRDPRWIATIVPTKHKRSRNLDSWCHSSPSNDRNMSHFPRKLAAKINIERGNEAVLILTFALQCIFIG